MTTTTSAVRPKAPLSPLRIISSILFLLFGILSIVVAVQMSTYLFQIFNYLSQESEENPQSFPWFSQVMYFLFSTLATPIVAILVAVLGLILTKRWIQTALGVFLFLFVFGVSWVWQLALSGSIQNWTRSWDIQLTFADTLLGWISLLVCALALALSVANSLLTATVVKEASHPETVVVPQSTKPTVAPTTQTSGQSNLANLPMFALIGAFIIPLAGIILGHLSLSYMKKGQLSEENKGMAKAGLILGYVFVGFTFLVGLVFVIALISASVVGY
jgi:hypothetical protein